jgi:hypothetical protein
MPRKPYRVARQEHLGDMLDHLESLDLLTWGWDYNDEDRRAIYWVTEQGRATQKLDTRRAEELALKLCGQQGIVWLPVPQPGGKTQRTETLRRIEELKQGFQPTEASTAERIHPIGPVPIELAAYPELQQRHQDKPTGDRSAQTFGAAVRCFELGLSSGQAKWFLALYPPFLDKYKWRTDADRELDRVVAKAACENAAG